MEGDANDLECRVCRNGPEDGRPLYFPCLCSGSIGAVHQDCLEAWLDHSKKDTCELCLTKYRFEPHYADGMPDSVSAYLMAKSVLKMLVVQVLPFALRIAIALVLWVLIVPVLTTCIYSICVGRSTLVPVEMSWNAVRAHIVHGFNIDAVIAMSLLILVSFTDFLRFHLVPVPPDGAAPVLPNGVPVDPAAPAPAVAMVGENAGAPAPALEANAQAAGPPNNGHLGGIEVRRVQPHGLGARRRLHGRRNQDHQDAAMNVFDGEIGPAQGGHRETGAHQIETAAAPRTYRREDNPLYRPPTAAVDTATQSGLRTLGIAMESAGADADRTAQPQDEYQYEEEVPDLMSDSGDSAGDRISDRDSESSWETLEDEHDGDGEGEGAPVDVNHADAVREQVMNNVMNNNNIPNWPAEPNNGEQGGVAMGMDGNLLDADFGLDDNMNPQEAGVEIRLALFEILGVEGPFHLMFRNSFWLLIFCGMYLFFTAMVPFMIGKMLLQVVSTYTALPSLLPVRLVALLDAIQRHSTQMVPLQFLDFFYVSSGFSGIFSAVFVLDGIATVLKKLKLPNAVKTVLELVGKLAVVIKVGTLLLVRIFLLPLCLGSVIVTVAAHTLLTYSTEQWGAFIATHCLGAFAVAWVAGITFMLTMTISVLQLREVLHPKLFGKLIRPQEPHVDLIQSLINESGPLHIRRIAISLFVYIMLMSVMVWLPMLQLRLACYLLGVPPFYQLKYWYVLPEIQIPLEIMVGHIVFLSVLDKHKDIIGHAQHVVMVYLAEKVGLTRFLIPLATLGNWTGEPQEDTAGGDVRVGAPLKRPPPGWDIRTPNQSTRWAWGKEEPSATERNVAPQVVPVDWLPRTAVLVLLCTAIINAITLFLLAVPLLLGRALVRFVCVPQCLHHDPLHFVLGCVACILSVRTVYKYTPSWSKVKQWWNLFLEMEVPLAKQVLVTGAYALIAQVCVAVLLVTLTRPPQQLFLLHLYDVAAPAESANGGAHLLTSLASFSLFDAYIKALQLFVLSCVVSYVAHSLLTSESVMGYLANLPGRREDPTLHAIHEWMLNTKHLPKRALTAVANLQFTERALRLSSIQSHVLFPFVYEIGVRCIAYSAIAAVIAVTVFFRANTTIELLSSAFQQCVYLYLIGRTYYVMYAPVKGFGDALNRQVLNDNYLIGRTLVNNHPQQAAASAPPSPAVS